MVRDVVYPKCSVCLTTPPGGMMEGNMIARRFLCCSCVEEIVSLSPGEAAYDHILGCLDGLGAAILRRVRLKGQ